MIPRFVALVALLLGCSTWIPLHAGHHPQRAMIETPIFLFVLAGALGLALFVVQRDRWLGAFVGYVAVRALIPPSAVGLQTALWVGLAAAALVLVRDLTDVRWIVRGLVLVGLVQIVIACAQAFGYDPLYPGTTRVHGTLESPKMLAGTLAVIGAVVPASIAPLFALSVVSLHGFLAAAALAVAWALRLRAWRSLVIAGVLVGATLLARGVSLDSLHQRLFVWTLAARDWISVPMLGHGFGQWSQRIPPLQLAAQPGTQDVYVFSYSEPVQLLYEGGLVALVLLAGWLWAHRSMWRSPFGPAAAALGVFSLGMFPFHVATEGSLGVLVLGLATRESA